jgi:hypothetical protein
MLNEIYQQDSKTFICFCSLPLHFVHSLAIVFKPSNYHLILGKCDKFDYTFIISIQNCDRIYQIFERNQIPIHYLSNKLNPNTKKLSIFDFD